MRPDGNFDSGAFQTGKPLHRHTQLRRRTAPKQIGWSRRNNQKVWRKRIEATLGFRQAQIIGLRVNQQSIMPSGAQLIAAKHEFQGNVRVLASKIGRALEIPVGIEQSKLHPALPESSVASAYACAGTDARLCVASTPWFSSQNACRS